MKKVKLPRKRKKAYIKANGMINYIALTVLGEIFQEEGKNNCDRYYTYSECTPTCEYPNGFKPTKRW